MAEWISLLFPVCFSCFADLVGIAKIPNVMPDEKKKVSSYFGVLFLHSYIVTPPVFAALDNSVAWKEIVFLEGIYICYLGGGCMEVWDIYTRWMDEIGGKMSLLEPADR